MKKKPRSAPDAVDKCVGRNLKLYRIRAGISQDDLANAVGISFQQIQKYESGQNRISASRILSLSKVLNVTLNEFYEGIDHQELKKEEKILNLHALDKDAIQFLDLYSQIENKETRKYLLKILKALNSEQKNG